MPISKINAGKSADVSGRVLWNETVKRYYATDEKMVIPETVQEIAYCAF